MISGLIRKSAAYIRENRLLLFFGVAIIYFEAVYTLVTTGRITRDFVFTVLFSISAAALLYLAAGFFKKTISFILTCVFTALLASIYYAYYVYYSIFKVTLSLYSVTGAKDAFQFKSVVSEAIINSLPQLFLLVLPLAVIIFMNIKKPSSGFDKRRFLFALAVAVISTAISMSAVNLTRNRQNSQYTVYYKVSSPQLTVARLGLLTTVRLDINKLLLDGINRSNNDNVSNMTETTMPTSVSDSQTTQSAVTESTEISTSTSMDTTVTQTQRPIGPNILNIDFAALADNETDKAVAELHGYFAALAPSMKNEYTGMFEGKNLIFIVAESFYPYAVSKELTPTLYMMANEGFKFNNFYNPLFGVSTSDGEYIACTSLLPKPGVWSFYISGRNYMPFAFGNMFGKLGYLTKAYHNHTYTYYNRHVSHPNMGYDYKGVGNGLDIKVTWPESDFEMIEVTTDEFIGNAPFHVYYLTVSGHLQYNFGGNEISKKNREKVEHLPYSNASLAYLACNLELEFAMKELIQRLDEAGELENTVIAISPDHYPYGLTKSSIEELSGEKISSTFDLYKGIFILWNAGMEPVEVDAYCSSLDINPTISNLFGLEFDSRLLMGNDIFSERPPLVIFADHSWITDRAKYVSTSNKVTFFDPDDYDAGYVKQIHTTVSAKFKFSTAILEKDYYGRIRQYID